MEEERRLRQLVDQGLKAFDIGAEMGKNANAVYEKAKRLGLRVIISRKSEKIITSSDSVSGSGLASGSGSDLCAGFVLSESGGLPSVEQALKFLVAAIGQMGIPGLGHAEVNRLRGIINGVKVYKELFADYLKYKELEQHMVELAGKYPETGKKAEDV